MAQNLPFDKLVGQLGGTLFNRRFWYTIISLLTAGDRFGDLCYVIIVVSSATPTPVLPSPTPTPQGASHTLYFYAGLEGCPYSRRMGPTIERLYQEFGPVAALPSGRPAGLAAPLALPPIQGTKRGTDFYLVAVPGWGTSESSFRNATGVTFPLISDPGLPVSTSRIPVIAIYNKQTGVTRIATIGDVSFSTLKSNTNSIMAGQAPQPGIGRA